MLNIEKTKVNAIVKQTKKLSVLLVLCMLFLSVFTVGTVGEQEIKPDLIISGLVVHGKIVDQEEIRFEVTIFNQQDVDIDDNIRVGLYHDYSWGAPVDSITISGGLDGDESESVNLRWTAEPGVYTFSIFVDYPNEIIEEDENNNVRDISLNISERNTDFKFLEPGPIIDEERRVDSPVAVSATVENIGKNTSEDIIVALYVNDSKKQELTIDGLSKGETYPLSFTWIPESFGVYTIKIEINPGPDRPITEERYNNNVILEDNVFVNITSLQWWNPNWHYRKFYELSGSGNISVEMNFTEMLQGLDVTDKEFENDTITIVKYTTVGDVKTIVANVSFNESEEFNSIANAIGNLTWAVNESLYYCIYFDVKENQGMRIARNETLDLNTSGTSLTIVFEGSEEGWWMYQNGSFQNYYTVNEEMSIGVITTAIADVVQANFYLEEIYQHNISLDSGDGIDWSGVHAFSTIGNWTVEIVGNDTANFQPEHLIYEFYVGVPDLGVVNISVPTTYFDQGDIIVIDTWVTNTGNEDATNYRVNLYIENHDDGSMHYTSIKNHTFVSVKKDKTRRISLVWDNAEPGEWMVGVKILQNATKPDANILNNSKVSNVKLKVNATTPPENNNPVITIIDPRSFETFERNTPVEILAKITDESGIKSVKIDVIDPDDHSYTKTMTAQGNNRYSYLFEDTDILGNYSFTITAVDNSGNNNKATKTSNFTIIEDATPPDIEYVRVLPKLQLEDHEVTISSIITDRSGVSFVDVTIIYPDESSETKSMTNSSGDTKYYFTQGYDMLGRYEVYITTQDVFENEISTEDEVVVFWITNDLEDIDSDGMPDWWEEKYGFDPYNPDDASKDEDDDGYSNVEEYEEGTNPLESPSFIQRMVSKSKEHWVYALISGLLCILLIVLCIYGITRRNF